MEEQVVKFEDIVKGSIKKWKLIVVITVLFTTLAAIVGMVSNESISYSGTIKILIKNQPMVVENNVQVKKDEKLIQNYIELMKTRDFLNSSIKNLNPSYKLTPEILLGKMKITNLPSSDFIQVVYESGNKNETVEVIEAVLNQFKVASAEYSPKTEYLIEDSIGISENKDIKNSKHIIILGLVGGLVFGFIVAFVFECVNRSFRTKGEIERVLKLNVIGTVPTVGHKKAKDITKHIEQGDVLEEAYNSIATNVKYNSLGEEKVILITSSVLEEGNTTIASRVAMSLASSNEKVALLDCNLRNTAISKIYGLDNQLGLSEVVNGKITLKEAIKNVNETLYVLPAGKEISNPVSVIDSKKMDTIIEELKSEYDYVVIDAPPVKVVADAIVLSTKADSTILVVRAEKAKYDTVQEVIDTINGVGGKIKGIVFNRADTFVNKFYKY